MVDILKHSNRTGISRRVIVLAILVLALLLTWTFWPVRITLVGSGIAQPRIENLVYITPRESGMVCRVMKARLHEVQAGEPLLEYVPEGKFSVLSYSRMTTPGGGDQEPEPLPDWYQKLERERIARITAANRWSGRVVTQSSIARKWESDLAKRLTLAVPREEDMLQLQTQQRESIKLGRENANSVYTFNETIGELKPTDNGIPLTSPVSGILYSLWVQPQSQIFGSPSAVLPLPPSGSPPMAALYSAASYPVGEIIPPGTPIEILAIVPISPHSTNLPKGWQAVMINDGQAVLSSESVTNIEIGRISMSATDAKLIMKGLQASQESVFARLSLKESSSIGIGTVITVRLISPSRPRAWYWIKNKKLAND